MHMVRTLLCFVVDYHSYPHPSGLRHRHWFNIHHWLLWQSVINPESVSMPWHHHRIIWLFLQSSNVTSQRTSCGIGKYDHISPTLKSLHWLPVKQRIEFKISVLVYKCLNGLAPQYLCKLLHFYAKDRDLRSADDKTLLEMPQSRTKFGERAFCYYAPKIWNSLPKDIRSSKSIDTFKKKVKTHLFSLAYHGKWLLKLII